MSCDEIFFSRFKRDDEVALAVRQGLQAILPIIGEDFTRINQTHANGYPLLLIAVHSKNEEMVKFLLDNGADVNFTNMRDESALDVALEEQSEEMVKILLEHGAQVDNTLLHFILVYKNNASKRLFKLLLDKGVDVNATNDTGETVVHKAIRDRNYDILKIIFQSGVHVDLELKDADGSTPLICAVQDGYRKIIKLLLDHGADIGATDKNGRSAVRIARYPSTVAILLQYGAEMPSLLGAVCSRERFELLLDYGADVRADADKLKMLERAIVREDTAMLQLLLDYGVELDLEDKSLDELVKATIAKCKKPFNSKREIRCAAVITRHVAKLKYRKRYVPEKLLEYIDGNKELKDMAIKCRGEIWTSRGVFGSYWRMLLSRGDNPRLVELARSQCNVDLIRYNRWARDLPIYWDTYRNQLRRGNWRKMLEDKVKYFFKAVGEAEGNGHLPKLPILCVREIFSYFSNRDFRSLIRVCDPHNDFTRELSDVYSYCL